jgi:hypothetical protein
MKEIDTVKDLKAATYKRLEDFRKDKTKLMTQEEQLKKQKVKDASDLENKLKNTKIELTE